VLQQQYLEHGNGRKGRPTGRRGINGGQSRFERTPIQQRRNPFQPGVATPDNHHLRKPALP
jgi:hypothetical protein